MKTRINKNQPFIYTAFPNNKKESIFKILDLLKEESVTFYYADSYKKSEIKKIDAACAILLFVDQQSFNSKEFKEIVDNAVKFEKNILCVYLEDVIKTPWSIMQLDSQQAIFKQNVSDEELVEKLKQAEIFKDMKITDSQKKYLRNRAISFTMIPIIVAVLAFFFIINPLLIEPAKQKQSFLDQLGLGNLTQEEIDNVKEIYIVGDKVFTRYVHAWYTDSKRMEVVYNYAIDDNDNQVISDAPIEIGGISDLSQITVFKNLEVLYIEGNQITDLSPIYELKNLKRIGFNCNPISDISGIEKLQNLNDVELAFTDITDISPLFDCPNIHHIQINGTNVKSLDGIESLKNLNALHADNTLISDISNLSSCNRLEYLTLNNTKVRDFSVLSSLDSLKYIELEDNNISYMPTLSQNNLSIWIRTNRYDLDYSFIKGIKNIDDFATDVGGHDDEYNNLLINIEGRTFNKFICAGLNITSLNDLSGMKIKDGGELNISHAYQLVSLDGIENFLNIGKLDLKYAYNLENLSPILQIKNLEQLTISSDMKERAETQLANRTFEINYRDD